MTRIRCGFLQRSVQWENENAGASWRRVRVDLEGTRFLQYHLRLDAGNFDFLDFKLERGIRAT